MKQLSLLLFITFFYAFSYAQFPNNASVSNKSTIYHIPVLKADSALMLPIKDTLNNPATIYAGSQTIRPQDVGLRPPIVYLSNGIYWGRLSGGGGSSGDSIAGGTVTTIPIVGTVINTNIPTSQAINELFFGAQPPASTLTGGGTFEITNVPTSSKTLTWTASRQSATATLSTIVVGGVNKTFSQPSAPGSVGGTQVVTVTANINSTFNNVVTATDSKSSTSSTTFTYLSKIYLGFVSAETPTDGDIMAATGVASGGTFATSRLASGTSNAPSGSKYFIVAYPFSFGSATIKINGLTVIFNLTTRSFVNASGGTVAYNIYTSPYPTSGSVEYQVL